MRATHSGFRWLAHPASAAAVVVLMVATGGSLALAGHRASEVAQYTGCLDVRGAGAGTVRAVKQGTASLRRCGTGERSIHLSGGDITHIATPSAGGLAGASSNGSATLSLRPSFRLPQGCSGGRVARWNGSSWVCASDANTTYQAGNGLALEGTTFDVTGAPWAGVTGVPPGFADGVDDAMSQPLFARTTLDSTGNVGRDPSVAVGADGRALISYYDAPNAAVKVAHCVDVACSSASTTSLDSEAASQTSVTIGADGLGVITYPRLFQNDLIVAHCEDVACTTATATNLTTLCCDIAEDTSVTIGTDGLPLIGYYDTFEVDLKVAHCDDVACTSADKFRVDGIVDVNGGTSGVGDHLSVTIGADGLPLISYQDGGDTNLKVAHCQVRTCEVATKTTLDSAGAVGRYTSVAIGADGLGLISYYDDTNGNLKVAHCNNVACNGATITTLDSAGNVGISTSVTIGDDGLGLISYHDATNGDLKVAHCSNVTCSSATTTTVDSAGAVGTETSVTLGADGLGLISYYDPSNGDLKLAHCSDPFCVPFARRR